MYRVLLVDDDMIVRMFLKDVVRWEQYGFSVCGAARDGEEALALCEAHSPDLIVTDVSMPQMDGIALIRQLRHNGYDGVIIVLSCHDDFSLVKSAMQEGADDYALKNHVDECTIPALLADLHQKVETRSRQSRKRQRMQSLATCGLRSLQHDLLKDILSGRLTGTALVDRLQFAGLYGEYRRMMVILVRCLGAEAEQCEMLFSLCEQRMQSEKVACITLSQQIFAMVLDLTAVASAQDINYLYIRLENVVQSIAEQYLNVSVGLAASAVCTGDSAWNDALRQAWDMLPHSFYGSGRWQYGQTEAMATDIPMPMQIFSEGLADALRQNDLTGIQKGWQTALEAARACSVSPSSLLAWLRRCDHTAGVTRTEHRYSEASLSFECYAACVQDYLACRKQVFPEAVSSTIREAAQFVQTHYIEQIGLPEAAQAAGLTAGYLSVRFKKEMGIGFAEYLLDVRLSHVKRGLRESDLTVKTLSEQAGFQDYPYFCKAFKRRVGVTPKEYRKQN